MLLFGKSVYLAACSVGAGALVILGHFLHLHGQTLLNRETSASLFCQPLFRSPCLYLAHLVPKAR